jgi:hypothetical protein
MTWNAMVKHSLESSIGSPQQQRQWHQPPTSNKQQVTKGRHGSTEVASHAMNNGNINNGGQGPLWMEKIQILPYFQLI